jgi:hypothetical protein
MHSHKENSISARMEDTRQSAARACSIACCVVCVLSVSGTGCSPETVPVGRRGSAQGASASAGYQAVTGFAGNAFVPPAVAPGAPPAIIPGNSGAPGLGAAAAGAGRSGASVGTGGSSVGMLAAGGAAASAAVGGGFSGGVAGSAMGSNAAQRTAGSPSQAATSGNAGAKQGGASGASSSQADSSLWDLLTRALGAGQSASPDPPVQPGSPMGQGNGMPPMADRNGRGPADGSSGSGQAGGPRLDFGRRHGQRCGRDWRTRQQSGRS